MVSNLPPCPRCDSRRLIRFGFVAGKQRWRCKRCRYQFTGLDGHGTPEPTKRAAVSLYGYGLSFNTVAHLLGTTAQSVLRWVCRYVDYHCSKPPPGGAVVIELDEMWHFLQRKTNKVWIWKAYDRGTGRLVAACCTDGRDGVGDGLLRCSGSCRHAAQIPSFSGMTLILLCHKFLAGDRGVAPLKCCC